MIEDYTKQEELINVHKFDTPINVIGCGALGSWLILILIKMGFKNINVYDFDTIEEHNIPNQAFSERQIGKSKVEAMQDIFDYMCVESNPRINIMQEKITSENASKLKGIVMCCVDSMKARKEIYQYAYKYGNAELWIEGRIGLFGAYVYTLDKKDYEEFEQYEKTLYADEEAEVSACGVSQTALPAAMNAATTMVMQLISKTRNNNIINEIMYQMPDYVSVSNTWRKEA